jgi:KUP system potassium uptake protein
MTSNPTGTPPALMQSLMHTRAVHDQVILLTIKTEEVPIVPEDERLEVEELPNGFHRIVARYGFTEEPDVPALLARADTPTPTIEYTTFFVGRETIIPQGVRGMSRSRARLFSLMLRNALDATAFFGVPPTRVLEVGAQVEL